MMDEPAGTAVVTFSAPGGAPTIEQAAGLLDVPVEALDRNFGVVAIGQAADIFAVVVADDHLPDAPGVAGARIFSNPSIAAFRPADVGDREGR